MHLGRVGEVANTCLHRKHWLYATRGLLESRLEIRDVLEGKTKLILVFLRGLILLVPDRDGWGRLHNQRKLVANEVFERIDLMIHETMNTLLEVCLNSIPLSHGI